MYLKITNIVAVSLWLYGKFLWYQSGLHGPRDYNIGMALVGFMLFVLLADQADEIHKGASNLSRAFGIIGLIVMVGVIKAAVE